MISDYM